MEQMWKFKALLWILLFFLSKSSQQTIFNSELYSFFQNRSFVGVWEVLNQNEIIFSDLDIKQGEIKVEFLQHSVMFEIFNHNYQELDEKFQGQLSLNHFTITHISWEDCNKTEIKNSNYQKYKICIPQFMIQIVLMDINKIIDNKTIAIVLNSNNTEYSQSNFQINLSTLQNNEDYDFELIFFESFALLFWISQIIIPLYFLKYVLHRKVKFYTMSIISQFLKLRELLFIFQLMIFSSQNSIFYILLLLIYVFLMIFWTLLIAIMLEQKLNFYNFFRRSYINKFTSFVVLVSTIIINFILFDYYSSYFVFWLSYSVILYPQIIHNVRLNIEENFNFMYLFGYLSSGLIFQTYLKCYPGNIFDLQPDYLFIGLYYFIYIISVILLYLQHKFGSRCFIPNCILKKDDDICIICLDVMEKFDWEKQVQLLPIIKTNCNHKFHQECLQTWLLIKQLCPLCRTPLNL